MLKRKGDDDDDDDDDFCRKSSIPKTLWLIQNEELKAEELLRWCSPSQKLN